MLDCGIDAVVDMLAMRIAPDTVIAVNPVNEGRNDHVRILLGPLYRVIV
jgi:hypothetical protein